MRGEKVMVFRNDVAIEHCSVVELFTIAFIYEYGMEFIKLD